MRIFANMKGIVPIRANIQTSLTEEEKDCVVWWVISGRARTDCFRIFCHPELQANRTVLEKLSTQFFASAPVMEYAEAYRSLLNAPVEKKLERSYSAEEMKSRKECAVQKLMNYIIDQSNNIDYADNKEEIIKFADKLGLLENEEVVTESPRRYLPETCSGCRYKVFVEENCVDD